MPNYVPYTDDVEVPEENEAALTREVVEEFDKLRRFTFEKHRHAVRDAHAKSHGILRGSLTVADGLDAPLAQGLFAAPKTYDVIVRFSTSPGDVLPDGVSAFRGLALKILDVEGEKVLPEEADARTQDFLLINHPVIPTGTIQTYLDGQRRAVKATQAPEELQVALTSTARLVGDALRATGIANPAGALAQAAPESHPVGDTFFTAGALRFGEYIAKLAVVPASDDARHLAGTKVDVSEPGAIRDAVVEFFRTQGAEYDVRAQLCTDLTRMPIEDGSVVWPEDEAHGGSAYRTVARLTLPAQDAYSPARRVYADEVLSFNPFHALTAHRPLGAIMRVRRSAYEASTVFRHHMNARPRVEPRSIDELPD